MTYLRPKAVYLFYYAALACFAPYMTLLYAERGMSGAQIGVLAGILPLVNWVSAPLWGGIADANRRHRAVLLLTLGGLCAAAVALAFADTFTELLLVVIAYAVFVGPNVPMIDNAVMGILGEKKANYGRIRLWGSVGWGGAALFVGPLIDNRGLTWGIYGFVGLMLVCMFIAARLPMNAAEHVRHSYSAALGVLARNGRYMLLLLVSLVFGITLGVLLSYQFLYIEELGGSRSLMAWTMTANTISEVPFWFISSALMRRFGTSKMIALALAATVVRNLAMGAVTNPWLVLPIGLLHGPSFAVLWAAGVADADAAAPPGLGATAQGLFSGMMFGLGSALGGFFGGPIYEIIGFATLYTLLGWLALGMLVLFVAARIWKR